MSGVHSYLGILPVDVACSHLSQQSHAALDQALALVLCLTAAGLYYSC